MKRKSGPESQFQFIQSILEMEPVKKKSNSMTSSELTGQYFASSSSNTSILLSTKHNLQWKTNPFAFQELRPSLFINLHNILYNYVIDLSV